MDYQILSQTMLFRANRRKKSKKCSPASVQSQEATEKVRSSIMPENAYIRWDWCSPEMFRLKVMMSGEITVY